MLVVWSVPRLTQGAFRACLDTMFTKYYDRKLEYICTGKPSSGIFSMAQQCINKQIREATGSTEGADTIYMVGDNPKSDIRGANAMGTPWVSVLVRTGNFKGEINDETHPAQLVLSDAAAAVDHILAHHR